VGGGGDRVRAGTAPDKETIATRSFRSEKKRSMFRSFTRGKESIVLFPARRRKKAKKNQTSPIYQGPRLLEPILLIKGLDAKEVQRNEQERGSTSEERLLLENPESKGGREEAGMTGG